MIKYWAIGTSSKSMIKKFINLLNVGITAGEKISTNKVNKINKIIDLSRNELMNVGSDAKIGQDLLAWEAMGFIKKINNHFVVLVDFIDFNELANYSKLYIIRESNNERINKYRTTLEINILTDAKIINQYDLEKLNVQKTKNAKPLDIEYIKKWISDYEKYVSQDKYFLRNIRRKYDKKF